MDEDWSSDDYEEVKQAKRRTIRSALIISSIIFLCTFILGGYLIYSKIFNVAVGVCGNKIIEVKTQPNNEFDFVHFKRDCGATTGYSYQLSILDHGSELPNKGGNVFISEQDFDVEWKDDRTILLSIVSGEIYKKKKMYRGVKIEYKDS